MNKIFPSELFTIEYAPPKLHSKIPPAVPAIK